MDATALRAMQAPLKDRYKGDPKAVEQALRKTLAAAHNYRPTDRRAVFVANIMEQLTQFRIISLGLQVLLSFIGALTLGIAGIGLMNIMLVSVQQRTREIGVEKALGARKRHILLQFLAEALVISGIGGVGVITNSSATASFFAGPITMSADTGAVAFKLAVGNRTSRLLPVSETHKFPVASNATESGWFSDVALGAAAEKVVKLGCP